MWAVVGWFLVGWLVVSNVRRELGLRRLLQQVNAMVERGRSLEKHPAFYQAEFEALLRSREAKGGRTNAG